VAPIKADLRLGIECQLEFIELQRHIRAFDLKGQSIKGYLLSRLKEGRSVRPSTAPSGADSRRHERVAMEIRILPGSSRTQERSISTGDGKAKIGVRRALLYYVLRRLGLDTDPMARRPADQQIVRLNGKIALSSAPGTTVIGDNQ
jgi:hypothetical protein